MRTFPAALVPIFLFMGCLLPRGSAVDGGTDGGGSNPLDGSRDATPQDAMEDAPGATGCSGDPGTGVILCSSTASCPSVLIDRDAYPSCGFRPGLGALNPVCLCSGYICPLGSASSCQEAQALIANQTVLQVCSQVSEGRCLATSTASGRMDSGLPACDRDCLRRCGAAPECKTLCGC